ncbi:sulfite exporter TauE/SafE family protein 3-like [Vicia villosa]|uniref:sulfite exporter TauE/SafE family protein 3-like n=1 Tax=Vicia villosa TaxID=3911 RepID=UPI00273B1E61|nr:sulfite exporter TauE/SafE family protein 3-like [Vicia villosa]
MKNVALFSFILLFVLLIFCANRTIKYEESSSLQSLYHHVKVNSHSGYEHIWPNIEFGWEIIVGSLIGVFGASFGSVGGVGGGGIFVPMLILIIGFDAKSATAISKCMVTGAAISTVFFNLKLRHPTLDIPMIDYDLVVLNQPVIILGISIGVVLSVVFADWMITVLLILIFIVTSVKAFIKGLDTWKKESIVKEEFVKHLESTATSSDDVEYKYLPSCPDDEPQKKINQGTILSNIRWKEFGLLCFVWIAVLILQIAKNYTATCSITYWILTLLQIPVTLGVSMYQAKGLYQGKKITVSKQDHGTHWPLHLLIVSLSCALLAGILGGLLGVGSGFVMGPLFIEFGIAPQVASATATLGMTFTASISVAQYFLLNRFPVPYALYLTLVATIAAYLGQKVIDRLVNMFQRASLIIFVLSFTILVSAIALGGVGISHMIEKIQKNEYMGFEDLCY